MVESFAAFAIVGFLAQLVDGALGMGYGIISSTVLLFLGVPPAQASASVHAAKLFTTATAGSSHIFFRNVDWPMFRVLSLAGALGGLVGVSLLTSIDGRTVRPYVVAYLGFMGATILWRALQPFHHRALPRRFVFPLGTAGGFLDATGGGGWGPVVTSSLMGAGSEPRYVVGTVNTAEFVITAAILSGFVVSMLSGHWQDAAPSLYAVEVGGLVAGGLLAAPLAGFTVRIVSHRHLKGLVGLLVLVLSGLQLARLSW